uniref:Uncharacterized protein n=1 Tax=Anguilla anguilla TaxID=7936 RepID=A0A0E9R584_ANGAN
MRTHFILYHYIANYHRTINQINQHSYPIQGYMIFSQARLQSFQTQSNKP